MNYEALLKNAPAQDSSEFLDYLREHNEVLWEDSQWVVIKNAKYGWPTAFSKNEEPYITRKLLQEYGAFEWRKKAADKQTVPGRFHFHIIET